MTERGRITDSFNAASLVVGIGSPHGDDPVGWAVAGEIASRLPASAAAVQIAKSPIEMLHWTDDFRHCVLCDACRGAGPVGSVHRWQWPAEGLQSVQWSGTHDLPLPVALKLAETLGRLPEQVILWAVEGDPSSRRLQTSSDISFSRAVTAALPRLVEGVLQDVQSGLCDSNRPRTNADAT